MRDCTLNQGGDQIRGMIEETTTAQAKTNMSRDNMTKS